MHRGAVIGLLPEETRSTLRSTQILTSLPQIVSELVQNSLDADARQVDVGVDPEAWACWVRDDGCGIAREGLGLLARGKEKARYGTSKRYGTSSLDASTTFGFRGEALASAFDLATVEISSRVAANPASWCIIIRGGAKLYEGPARRWTREIPGTIVNIKDAFFNLPVRRLTHPTPSTSLQAIRRDMEKIALMFPHVGFTLEKGSTTRGSAEAATRILTIVKTSSTLNTFSQLFGRGLVQNAEMIDEKHGGIKIEGFLSREGSRSKSSQYLYVNRHPVISSELHCVIDAKFAATSFGTKALDETGESAPHAASRRFPRKSERRPVYVLNITVPSSSLDVTLEPAKADVYFENAGTVAAFLGQTIQNFLTRNGFPPHGPRKLRSHGSADLSSTPTKRRRLDDRPPREHTTNSPPIGTEHDSHHIGGAITSKTARVVSTQSLAMAFPDSVIAPEDSWVPWRDPTTGELYVIDTRSGNSIRQSRGSEQIGRQEHAQEEPLSATTSLVDRRWLRGTRPPARDAEISDWISSMFKACPNPTFDSKRDIHAQILGARRLEIADDCCRGHEHRGPGMKVLSRIFDDGAAGDITGVVQGRLSKASLERATVINQVDRRFIACKIPARAASEDGFEDMLVIIDQHAADERVRVEYFLQKMCNRFLHHSEDFTITIRELDPPRLIIVTKQDAEFLERSPQVAETFERWGFRISVSPYVAQQDAGSETPAEAHLAVSSIPDVVAVKLLLGDELRELVKGFLAKLQDQGMETLPTLRPKGVDIISTTDAGETEWMKAIRWCPEGLIDLINSRACRGAIMFNDSLGLHQCQNLLQQLRKTVFPFQCAHGRPSMIPLTHLGATYQKRQMSNVDWARYEGSA